MDIRTQNDVSRAAELVPACTRRSSAADAAHKSWGAIYLMVQQQAAMLSFVEAFWVMGVIFWAMLPLLLLLRNARDLHPHTPARQLRRTRDRRARKATRSGRARTRIGGRGAIRLIGN